MQIFHDRIKYLGRYMVILFLCNLSLSCAKETEKTMDNKADQTVKPKFTNRLAKEQSPYLLQHQHNPVDWYPWGDEAFEKAKKEDKPIFLSIGYSTCHWCHVMEHESFEDEEVGVLMNEVFVSIKVDREERPDIDNIYMAACHAFGQRGGWPLTILMTPDKKPFFAGTYYPKKSMLQLIPQIQDAWKNNRDQILKSADGVTDHLQKQILVSSDKELNKSVLDTAFAQLAGRFDTANGGFGRAPKFPTPHNLLFLLRQWHSTKDESTLHMVTKTLDEIALGGIHDHVGFGFHRYSTDHRWFLPHFEKMLYDQAMLAMAYLEAYQATGNKNYAQTAEKIFTYVLRDMTSTEGGFYSAEDADSEGEEGKFYLWDRQELIKVLGEKEGELFAKVYNATPDGNYFEEATGHRTGTNHFYLEDAIDEIAQQLEMDANELIQRLEGSRKKLFDVREKRIHPYKDDKILTDWNGLMIAAFAKGAEILNNATYAQAAQKAAQFIEKKLTKDGELLHRYRQGQAGIVANLDDYAFMIWGLLNLYEADFNVVHLERAIQLQDIMMKKFWDTEHGGFFFTVDNNPDLIVRQKDVYDGAIPSGNSVSMLNLYRLSRITGKTEYEENAQKIGKAFYNQVAPNGSQYSMMMCGLAFGVGPSYEIVISGDPSKEDTKAMIAALREKYIPHKVIILRNHEASPAISQLATYTENQVMIDNKATAYVCQNFTCSAPTTDVKKMMELIK